MKRLCIVDMNFTWPPDGGAPVDLDAVATRYSALYDTTLIIPRLSHFHRLWREPWPLNRTKFFLRGKTRYLSPPPFKIEEISFSMAEFSPARVASAVRRRIEELKPDHVYVADAWYFKPQLLSELRSFRPVLRIYVHENMCLRGNGTLFRDGKACDVRYLDGSVSTQRTCASCALRFYMGYPSPRWAFEAFRSGAFGPDYQKKCIEGFNHAQRILVGNQWVARRLSPYVNPPIQPVPHGVDALRFAHDRRPPERPGPKRILALGRMEMKTKGIDVAIDACRQLRTKRNDFELWVTSSGSLPPDPFIRRTPWVRYERVHELYRGATMALVPSIGPDAFPFVTLEAMASGLPVIGSVIGGIPEQILDGKTGYLVPPSDVPALARSIELLLDDPKAAEDMGRSGQSRVFENFTWDIVFDRFYRHLFEPQNQGRTPE